MQEAAAFLGPQNRTQGRWEKYLIMLLPHVSCAGDNQGQPAVPAVDGAVRGQLLPGPAAGRGLLLVDAVRRRRGVHQDHGLKRG